MENIFFLALVAIIGLLRWLAQAAENKRNAEVARRNAGQNSAAPVGSEEERIRKFMEALGVPPTTTPPQRSTQRPQPPAPPPVPPVSKEERPKPRRTRAWGNPLPPLTTVPPPLPQEQPTAERRTVFFPGMPVPQEIREMTRPAPATVEVSVPAVFEVRENSQAVEEESPRTRSVAVADVYQAAIAPPTAQTAQFDVHALLASAEGLRTAVILQEILGRPRGLQPSARTLATAI